MTYRGWEGFLEGNGDYDYAGCHKAIRYSLHYRALPQRIQTVRALFTEGGPLFHLGDAIDRSYQSVLVYLEANAEFSQEREDLVEILKNYRDTLQHNVGFFTYELNAWRA